MQVGTKTWDSYFLETSMQTPAPNIYDKNCPTRLVLDRIADKWTVLIIGQLALGTLRFNELKRRVSGITQKMLTQTLKGLERDGMVDRKIYASVPPKVEYTLTELGGSLTNVVDAIKIWAESNIENILCAQQKFTVQDIQ
jgi:DNA-binding HxlR family transcriptional regulator